MTANSFSLNTPLLDAEYGSYIRAINSDGVAGEWSDLLRFTIGATPRPGVPELTIDDIENADGAPTLSWDSVRRADRYDLWVDRWMADVRKWERQVIRNFDLTTTSFTPDEKLSNGLYRAFLRSISSDDVKSTWSQKLDFRVRDIVLTPPVVTGPESTIREKRPEITWDAVEGATSYSLFVVDWQTRRWVDSAKGLKETSYRLTEDLGVGHYKVIVHALDQEGNYSRLSRQDFTVEGNDAPRPDRPGFLTPDPVTTDRSPVFAWTPVEHAVKYSLRIHNRSTGESNVISVDDLNGTSYQVPDNLPLGRYRAEVIAYNVEGLSSLTDEMVNNVTEAFEFTIEHPVPTAAESTLTPDNDDVDRPSEITPVQIIDRVLSITGSQIDDNVTVTRDGTTIVVNLNGTTSQFDRTSLDRIQFQGDSGNDRFANRTRIPAVASGGAGNDTLVGGGGDDSLNGDAGDDWIRGRFGRDVIDGGDGADTISGNAGNDTVTGGAGRDRLLGGPGHDLLSGGADNDTLRGQGGTDTLFGQTGDDKLFGNRGQLNQLSGGEGNDRLFGGSRDDLLNGDSGDDVLSGRGGNDILNGGAGHDTLLGGSGNDSLMGFTGNDVLRGQNGDDFLIGHDGRDSLEGGSGRDSLVGGSWENREDNETDTLNGGADSDFLDGDERELVNSMSDTRIAFTEFGSWIDSI